MKTMGKSIFKFLPVLFLFVAWTATAKGAQIEKTFSWKYPVTKATKVAFNNYNCDVVIHVWYKPEAEYHLTVEATGKTTDDETRLLKYLENMNFSHTDNLVSFRNNFWKNRRSINGKTTLEIEGEKDIQLTDFNMSGELWIPADNFLELSSKYSRVDMESFRGQARIDLYNDNLFAKNIESPVEITAKYSNLEFGELKDIKADLYNTDLQAAGTGNITIVSKYSKFEAERGGKLDADSYNDKYSINKAGDVNFNAKYSDLRTETAGNLVMTCYNGDFELGDIKDLKLDSKYASYTFNTAVNVTITSSYNDKFRFEKVNDMKINESKYSNYEAGQITGDLKELDGYNDNLNFESIDPGFKELSINGKYMDITLGLPEKGDFRLKANIKYPEIEFNEEALKTKIRIQENSELQYEGTRGTEKDDMPLINVNGYNIKLILNNLE